MTDTGGNDVAVSPRLQHMRCTLGGVLDQRERSEIAFQPIAKSQLAVDRCPSFFFFRGGGGGGCLLSSDFFFGPHVLAD